MQLPVVSSHNRWPHSQAAEGEGISIGKLHTTLKYPRNFNSSVTCSIMHMLS